MPTAAMHRTRRAIVCEVMGEAHVADVPLPVLDPKSVLVKTAAVALNQVDQVCVDYYSSSGCIVGCEFSGEILAVGHDVVQDLKIGDRVMGMVHGCKTDSADVLTKLFKQEKQASAFPHEHGAFTDIVLASGDLVFRMPDWMRYEEATVIPVGLMCAAMALYQGLKFPLPDAPSRRPTPILIYGGSSGTGVYAIQLAKLSGLRVLTTSSPHNFDYLKSLGADAVFDHHSPTVAADIRRAAPMLSYVFDCRATPESRDNCAKAICLSGGAYIPIMPVGDFGRADVRCGFIASFAAYGDPFSLGPYDIPAMKEMHEWCKMWVAMSNGLIADGKIKPVRQVLKPGGLRGPLQGIDDLRKYGQTASGSKNVYIL